MCICHGAGAGAARLRRDWDSRTEEAETPKAL